MALAIHGETRKDRFTVESGGYDWTVLPYGSLYDGRSNGKQLAGGYVPVDGSTAGRPAGSALTSTQTGSSGVLSITSAMMTTITTTATASAATDTVTAAAHGLVNGDPIYFTSLTGGSGLVTGPVPASPTTRAGWFVVANATTNTFTLREAYPQDTVPTGVGQTYDGGLFHDVDITGDYSAMTLVKGVRYDQVDFQCYIQPALTSTVGLVLITRSRFSGPASAGTAQGYIYAPSGYAGVVWVEADNECVPQSVSTYQDFTYGANVWSFRSAYKWVIDGHGSLGNVHLFGRAGTKLFWAYPDVATPSHTDGTHNDAGMQILGGDVHVMVGARVSGDVDINKSTTTDSVNHPISSDTVSALCLVGNNNPKDLYVTRNDGRNGGLAVNVANMTFSGGTWNVPTFSRLGMIFANEVHKADADKQNFAPNTIECPVQASGNPSTPTLTIHAYVPTSGADANCDENGTAVTNVNPAANATLLWP